MDRYIKSEWYLRSDGMNNFEWKHDRIEQLERTVLELGTEIYRLRSEVGAAKNSHENFLEIIKGLKLILDEKGLISVEDFENAVELGNAISGSYEPILHDEIEKIKKTSH